MKAIEAEAYAYEGEVGKILNQMEPGIKYSALRLNANIDTLRALEPLQMVICINKQERWRWWKPQRYLYWQITALGLHMAGVSKYGVKTEEKTSVPRLHSNQGV